MLAALARLDQVNKAICDHLLLFSVPLLALAVDVDPNAEAFFLGESTVSDLDWNLSILLATASYQDTAIRPSAIAINDQVLSFKLGMRFHQQRFKQSFIGLYLPLKLLIFFRPDTRLLRVWDNVIKKLPESVAGPADKVETTLPVKLRGRDHFPIWVRASCF